MSECEASYCWFAQLWLICLSIANGMLTVNADRLNADNHLMLIDKKSGYRRLFVCLGKETMVFLF